MRWMPARVPVTAERPAAAKYEGNVFSCPLDKIVPQKANRGSTSTTTGWKSWRQSLRTHGLLEPLIVRRRPGADDFEIIAGERRWRAAQRANLREVLVVVHDVSAKDAYELALIENVQREDLDAIEFAEALEPPDQGALLHARDARAARR